MSLRATRLFAVLALSLSLPGARALAQSATSTTIAASSSSVTYGSPVTLTATVTGATSGTIGFCDLTLKPHCLSSDLFSIKQLAGSGTVSTKVIPSLGSHSYRAVFTGTRTTQLSFSISPVAVTVSGTYPTKTTISSSGQTVTATVVGTGSTSAALNGSVTFNDSFTGTSKQVATASLGSATAGQSFVPVVTPAAFTLVSTVPAGDLNNDGYPDYIAYFTGAPAGDSFLPLFGTANGSFTGSASQFFGTVSGGTRLLSYDFNNDGYYDLAVSTAGGEQLYYGSATGTFTTGPLIAGLTAWGYADFNYDGIPDFVGPSSSAATGVQVYFGTGTSWTAGPTTALTGTMTDLATTDLNGDPVLDVIAVGTVSGTPTSWGLFSTGVGTFSGNVATTLGGGTPTKLVAVDMNGDKVQDIAVASTSGTVLALGIPSGSNGSENIPAGTGAFSATATSSAAGTLIATGDINGDGTPDIVVGGSSTTVSILFGNGSGAVSSTSTITPNPSTPDALVVSDSNGDGYADVYTASTQGVYTAIENYTETASTPATTLTLTGSGTHNLSATYLGDSAFSTSTSTSSAPVTVAALEASVSVPAQTYTVGAATSPLVATVTYTGAVPNSAVVFQVDAFTAMNGVCNVKVGGGSETCTVQYPTSTLSGSHTLYVTLLSDGNYNTTQGSGTLTATTTPKPSVMITVPAQTASVGATTVTLTANASFAVAPGQSPAFPTGTVVFLVDNANPTNATTSLTSATTATATATITLPALSAGSHIITVTVPGDANYSTSSGTGTLTTH